MHAGGNAPAFFLHTGLRIDAVETRNLALELVDGLFSDPINAVTEKYNADARARLILCTTVMRITQ
jgi:hypothetical protein